MVLFQNMIYDDVTLYKNWHTSLFRTFFFSLPENTFCRKQIDLNFRDGKQAWATKRKLYFPQLLRIWEYVGQSTYSILLIFSAIFCVPNLCLLEESVYTCQVCSSSLFCWLTKTQTWRINQSWQKEKGIHH